MTTVYVHSGVSGLGKSEVADLAPFARAGAAHLDALDAVEAAARELEDAPSFNAGFGSVLNIDGELEMDAGIADGAKGRCGGIANVRVRHPITLARRVMEETPHVLLTGAGAIALGDDMEQLPDTSPEQRERWEHARTRGLLASVAYGSPEFVDTIGAVSVDGEGNLAAASSTGGVFAKLPGRVGDAPIFGAGVYASRQAAVVGTGVGEVFLETLAALRTAVLIEKGATPQEACEEVIAFLGSRSDASAGLLALDREGRAGAAYRGGAWGVGGVDGNIEAVRLA
ncbi:MAG: isoaspartyl peptidase/L-asparaginase family protein [Actinomycetota bacterium]